MTAAALRAAGAGRTGWTLRIVGSVAFMALALWGIGVGDVAHSVAHIDGGWLAIALLALGASSTIAAARWWVVLRAAGIELSPYHTLRFAFIGQFFSNALPTGFGGDAVRIWMAGRRAGSLSAVGASVLVDRLAAVWALVALGLGALVVEGSGIPGEVRLAMIVSALAGLVATVLLLGGAPAYRLASALSRWGRLGLAVHRVGSSLALYRGRRRALVAALALSLCAQSCVAFAAWSLARGLGLHVSLLLLAAAIPAVLLATTLPASVNGLGVREAAFRALLVPAGIAPTDAVALSLATVAAGALISLPGAVWWLTARGRPDIRSGRPGEASAERAPDPRPPVAAGVLSHDSGGARP